MDYNAEVAAVVTESNFESSKRILISLKNWLDMPHELPPYPF